MQRASLIFEAVVVIVQKLFGKSLVVKRHLSKLLLPVVLAFSGVSSAEDIQLLNVSYDPTRELYAAYNKIFAEYWKEKTGDTVKVRQSHGGSGKQARAVIDGLEADVVTLALSHDLEQIHEKGGLIPAGWKNLLPNNSAPYTSTIVFLVRKGNPKNIRDWDDVVKPGVGVITPNPKTGGGSRYNYLAAWGYALKNNNNSEAAAEEFVRKLYKNVLVLDSGARGSSTTFLERGIGDVLLTWENEAFLALKEHGSDKVEIIIPSASILAEPSVTVVEKFAKKHGTYEVAKEYLQYLYSPKGQELIAQNYYRPRDPAIAEKYAKQFPKLELFTIDDTFGGWPVAQKKHFVDGAIFDKIYLPGQ
jgi:sulfate/thiosulfate-binding protein